MFLVLQAYSSLIQYCSENKSGATLIYDRSCIDAAAYRASVRHCQCQCRCVCVCAFVHHFLFVLLWVNVNAVVVVVFCRYCIFWMRCGGSDIHSGSLASSWTDSVSSLSSANIVKSEYCCVVKRFLQFVANVVGGVGGISTAVVDAVVDDGNLSPVTWSMQLFIMSL